MVHILLQAYPYDTCLFSAHVPPREKHMEKENLLTFDKSELHANLPNNVYPVLLEIEIHFFAVLTYFCPSLPVYV